MMRQYLEVKAAHQDCLVLFRCGDFYELFYDDAKAAARDLDITLTARDKGIPMAGVPHHAIRGYIARLLEAGHKVVVCDQVAEPDAGRKIFRREVTRVITPGVALEDDALDARAANYLMAIAPGEARTGVATLDVSTGEFFATELVEPTLRNVAVAEGETAEAPAVAQTLLDEIARVRPREILLPTGGELALAAVREALTARASGGRIATLGLHDATAFTDPVAALRAVCGEQGAGVEGFAHAPQALAAAGACASYVGATRSPSGQDGVAVQAAHVPAPRLYGAGDFLVLDESALAHLEVTRTLMGGRKNGSLLGVLDLCATSMGTRMLTRWLTFPLRDREAIGARHDAVEALVGSPSLRSRLVELLQRTGDLERLNARCSMGVASPRDLGAVRDTLGRAGAFPELLASVEAPLLQEMAALLQRAELAEVQRLLSAALVDEPPTSLGKGAVIRPGYSDEIDELNALRADSRGYILGIEARERDRTGIGSLKVGYNRVFGYFLEVTKLHAAKVPADYVRKQTLTNAERYITDELKQYEEKVLSADERIGDLEGELFGELRARTAARAGVLGEAARALATLDVVVALAEVAHRYGYSRPTMTDGRALIVDDGRHPVVERIAAAGAFVANDVRLDPGQEQLLIITGPNMAGKSTILRQVALISLLAQAGSFVPAKRAELPLLDRIFTRVGAADDLARGRSTFMVEMTETANILRAATPASLIILDEIGRGTSTFDGLSIAWAVAEFIHDRIGASTLFATHYHELTELTERCRRVRNFQVQVREWQGEVVFLHKLAPGGASRSYGIQVGRLAGLPPQVVARAKEVLAGLETMSRDAQGAVRFGGPGRDSRQLYLFAPQPPPAAEKGAASEVEERIAGIDPDALSPREALEELYTLKRIVTETGESS